MNNVDLLVNVELAWTQDEESTWCLRSSKQCNSIVAHRNIIILRHWS